MYTVDWKAVRRNRVLAQQSGTLKGSRPKIASTYDPMVSDPNESFRSIKNELDKMFGFQKTKEVT